MKKAIIITVVLSIFGAIPANALIDTQYTTTKRYMMNAGYSEDMAKFAELTTRDAYAPTDDIYPQKTPSRVFKLIWKKIDSTAFPDDNSTWHNIRMNTTIEDLN